MKMKHHGCEPTEPKFQGKKVKWYEKHICHLQEISIIATPIDITMVKSAY